jgi:hypothetical protein
MIYVDPAFVHTVVTLFEGGITSGVGMPVNVPLGMTERYVLVLLRNTQNVPSGRVPAGKAIALNPEFVML